MSNVSLNYVWINAHPHNDGVVTTKCYDPDGAVCPIPQRYLQNVRDVRQKYPDIGITVWMDAYKRNDKKGDLSRAFAKSAGVDGVSFRGLREIPEYRENSLFNVWDELTKSVKGVIWKQVDLARLMALHHAMKEQGGVQVYADFDFLEPPVDEEAMSRIKEHGILISRGADERPTIDDYDPYVHVFENNFMAFSEDSELATDLLKKMIQGTKKYYSLFPSKEENGWNAFCESFRSFKVEFWGDVPVKDLTITRLATPRNHSDYPGFRV